MILLNTVNNRFGEWYVPKFGPMWFRALIGLTYYPYTLMVSSFIFLGTSFSNHIVISRSVVLFLTYVICLGMSAHSFDSFSSKNSPWGRYINNKYLLIMGFLSLFFGILISFKFALEYHYLLIAGIVEIFFIFSYNLELFNGFFHNNKWLAFSTGSMPVVSGYLIQNGSNIIIFVLLFILGYSLVQIEIQASRPYRSLKKNEQIDNKAIIKYYEKILESVVLFSITLTLIVLLNNIWLLF